MKKILTILFILTAFSSYAQDVRFNSSTNSQYKSNLGSGSSSSSSSMQSTIRSNYPQGRVVEGNSPYAVRSSSSRYTYDGAGMEGSYSSDYEYLSNGVKQTIRSYGSSATPNGTIVEEVIIYKGSN